MNLQTQVGYGETDVSWYNGPSYTRGGVTSQYTKKSYFPNECEDSATNLREGDFDYFFKNLVVVTDGTCGSSCSNFVTQLQSHRALSPGQNVRVVTYCGNNPSVPMDSSSFSGGNVLDTNYLSEIFVQTAYNDTRLPIPFPTSAVARYTHNEQYASADATIPREFLKMPGDLHLSGHCTALYNDDLSTEAGDRDATLLYRAALVGL